jgi:hypothetical protein
MPAGVILPVFVSYESPLAFSSDPCGVMASGTLPGFVLQGS